MQIHYIHLYKYSLWGGNLNYNLTKKSAISWEAQVSMM